MKKLDVVEGKGHLEFSVIRKRQARTNTKEVERE